jgi:hypothetical protein
MAPIAESTANGRVDERVGERQAPHASVFSISPRPATIGWSGSREGVDVHAYAEQPPPVVRLRSFAAGEHLLECGSGVTPVPRSEGSGAVGVGSSLLTSNILSLTVRGDLKTSRAGVSGSAFVF